MIKRAVVGKGIAFVSSFPPRKCGIATFASDLIGNVAPAGTGLFEAEVIAMQSGDEVRYTAPVTRTIRRDVRDDYMHAADYINLSNIELVSVQHEFGLFGGQAGSWLGLMLERLRKPVVTTLHTVLDRPSPEYFDSLIEVCRYSSKVVVMNRRGIEMLEGIYGVPGRKIELIPHGIPDLPFSETGPYKGALGLEGRRTILTFGLLGRNKGIEVMLRALPSVVKADPSVLYIVLGATHPEVLRREGLSYKSELEKMAKDLKVGPNVVFHHRFADKEELFQFLAAADIYVTPYLHREQLTSGTLAFAVGTGRAVVSTPYWAAEELLAQGRGRLVGFGDSEQMARTIVGLLAANSEASTMRRLAYDYGRSMTWPSVGESYRRLFDAIIRPAKIPVRQVRTSVDWMATASAERQQLCQPV